MRAIVSVGLALTFCNSQAERLITIPVGSKVTYQSAVLSSYWESGRRTSLTFLNLGVTRDFEAEVGFEDLRSGKRKGFFGLSYNLLNPLVDFAPGLSVGVQDVLGDTLIGRSWFLASTFRIGLDGQFNMNTPFETTLGVSLSDRLRPFVGASIPLTWQVRGLFEHDGREITAGIEYLAFHKISLRWLHSDHRTWIGVNLSTRF